MANPRNRISWYACGVGFLLLAGAVIHLRTEPPGNTHLPTPPSPTRKSPVSNDARGPAPRRPPSPELEKLPDLPAPIVSPHPTGDAANQEWIEKRTDELDDLAWFDDPESLGKILTELRNPLPEIRAAALKATRDFGSRDAIPYLEAISLDSADPLEQKAIHDLIEHLKIPTLIEESGVDETE